MFNKIQIMSVEEFLHKDEKQIYFNINNNKKFRDLIIFSLASAMHIKTVLAVDASAKIDQAGTIILGICRKFGYWACIIMCIMEVIKSLMSGDSKSISKIISRYAIGFSALYFLPWLFDIIASIFK